MKLHRAQDAYPNMQLEQSTVVHSRVITTPDLDRFAPILKIGKGALANASTKRVTRPCEDAVNCDRRTLSQTWRRQNESIIEPDSALSFVLNTQESPSFTKCSAFNSVSTQLVRVEDEAGQAFSVLLHAQRSMDEGGSRQSVQANDRTDWSQAPDLEQSLNVWLPHATNSNVAAR